MRGQSFLCLLILIGSLLMATCYYDEGFVFPEQNPLTIGLPFDVTSSLVFPYMSNVDPFHFDFKLYKGKVSREAVISNQSTPEAVPNNFCLKEPISYKLVSILTEPIYNDTFNHVDFVNYQGLTYIISASPNIKSMQIFSMKQDTPTSPYRLELIKAFGIAGLESVFRNYNISDYYADGNNEQPPPPPNNSNDTSLPPPPNNSNDTSLPPPPNNSNNTSLPPPPNNSGNTSARSPSDELLSRPSVERLTTFLDADRKWIIIRLFSVISVYDVSDKENPRFVGNFSFIADKSYANETSVQKVQYNSGCFYIQIGRLSLSVYCVADSNNFQIIKAYEFSDNSWEDQRTNLTPELALNDFWIENKVLYAVGDAGLFIFDVSEVKRGIVSIIITHNDIRNGRLVKVANNSLIIIKEKQVPRNPISEWYFDEYFIKFQNTQIDFVRNREVFLHYGRIMSLHRTQKYVLIPNIDDTVRIFRHSTPQRIEFPQLERTSLFIEDLVKIHQSSNIYGNNLVLVVYPTTIQLFVVETEPLKVICTPSWPPDEYTIAVNFYTSNCPKKLAASNNDPFEVCRYKENFYFTAGIIKSEGSKKLAIGLGVGFGLLFLLVLSVCLYRKYKKLKGNFTQLQETITLQEQSNNNSSNLAGKNASHFDIDRNDKSYNKPGAGDARKLDDIYEINYKE